MADEKRILLLLEKELDGELSAGEKDELDRSILIAPELRREREAWKKLSGVVRSIGQDTPKLDTARMSARVLNARSRKLELPMRARWSWVLAASTAFAIVIAVLGADRRAPVPSTRSAPVVATPVSPLVSATHRAPVDVSMSEDEGDAELVEIRF